MTITTSLVVRFGDDDDGAGLLRAEIDSREDGFNQGRSSFRPGDMVHYLVYTGANTTLTRQVARPGSISGLGTRTREVEEIVTFADEREARLGYPVAGGLSIDWFGTAPGTAQLSGDDRLLLPEPGVGVGRVTYTTSFRVYRLGNLPSSLHGRADYTALVVLFAEVQ